MDPYRSNHFNRVAMDMNNYLIASTYRYYQNQHYRSIRDRRNGLMMYQRPSVFQTGLGGLLAYGFHAVGLPSSVVQMGYRFGYFLDSNA